MLTIIITGSLFKIAVTHAISHNRIPSWNISYRMQVYRFVERTRQTTSPDSNVVFIISLAKFFSAIQSINIDKSFNFMSHTMSLCHCKRLQCKSREESVLHISTPYPYIIERPDPKDLSTFSQCSEFLPHRGFELMSSRSESGVRCFNNSKWLASQMLVWDSVCLGRLLYKM